MQQQELFLSGILGDRHGHGLLPSILGGGDGNPGILGQQQQMQELWHGGIFPREQQQQELFLSGILGDRHGHGLLPSILGGGDGNPGILGQQQQMQELWHGGFFPKQQQMQELWHGGFFPKQQQEQELFLGSILGDAHGHGLLPSILG